MNLETASLVNELERSKLWNVAFENARFGYAIGDPRTQTVVSVNPSFAAQRGYTPEELIGRPVLSLFAPDRALEARELIRQADATGHGTFESEHRCKDGRRLQVLLDISVLKSADGRPLARLVLAVDISAQKQARDDLRAQDELLRRMSVIARVAGGRMDLASGAVTGTSELAAVLGQPEGAALNSEHLLGTVAPDHRTRVAEALRAATERAEPFDLEVAVDPEGGQRKWLRIIGSPVSQDGTVVSLDGAVQDISRRKEAEARLRDFETRYRTIVDQAAPDAMFVHDHQGRILEVNQRASLSTGYSREELLGMTAFDIDVGTAGADAQGAWAGIEPGQTADVFSHLRRKDGSTFPAEVHCGLLTLAGERLYVTFVHDVSNLRETQAALLESERRLRLAQEAARVGTWEWDLLTNRNVWTDEVFRLYGLEPGSREPSYDAWLQCCHPDDREQAAAIVASAASQGKALEFEWRVLGRDGRVGWLLSRGQPQFDANGKLVRYLGIVADITERKFAEATLRKLSLAVEQTPAIVIITDLASRIEYVNEAFVKQTGYSRKAALGNTPGRLLRTSRTSPTAYQDLFQTLHAGEVWQGDFINRRSDGTVFVSQATIGPLRQADGSITHYVSVQEDVTDARRLAAELERHRYHLEDLVARRTREVEAMREELIRRADSADAASAAKTTYLADMSHEIRTPMNAILGFAHLLEQSQLPPEEGAHVRKITAAGEHLLLVINRILDLSKIEAGKFVLEHIDFSPRVIAEEVRALILPAAEAKGLAVHLDFDSAPHDVRGDPTRIRQGLLNFASNAVKFTERGSVTIRLHVVREDDVRLLLRFEVEDTGPGIPAEQAASLFQPFQQADGTTARKSGGTGLGLVITRRFANLMGGEAGANSKEGAGSTFWFTAWLERGTTVGPDETEDPADALAHLRERHAGAWVLLVEDNPINQEVARALLSTAGLHVEVAGNGREALAMYGSGYQAILMDLQMPEMDGLDATRAIRAQPAGEAVPIIAMTANAFEEDRRRCIEAGMNDFIGKPVDPKKLYSTILRWLG